MTARDRIFSRLRHGRKPGGSNISTVPFPAHSVTNEHSGRVAAFCQRAKASGATVLKAQDREQLNTLLNRDKTLNNVIDIDNINDGDNPVIASDKAVTVVRADAGIAETGTVCFHSHQVASRSLFLCEHLFVILPESRILSYQEDYWATQEKDIPRAVHLITGPSRTADVEQTIQLGAHGPRFMTVLLLSFSISTNLNHKRTHAATEHRGQ